jgi:hypothetical protein
MRVPDWVYQNAEEVADEYDMTLKEAVGHMVREGDYGPA